MRPAHILLLLPFLLAACREGPSTVEMRRLAIDKARQVLKLPANVPLEARVWVGKERYGKPTMCGAVSDTRPGSAIPPQRFAATTRPLQWLVFQDAHAPMTVSSSDPNVFASWAELCASGQPAGQQRS